ncbi:MAG: EF-hand domain-containing protein [Pseudomonadota bacterium]
MKTLIATLALTLVLPVVAAQAQDSAPKGGRDPLRGFKLTDTDGDGKVSYGEYKTMSEKLMARRVAQHPDSRLAAANPDQREAMIKKRFVAMDANQDGMIDPAEWTNRPHGRTRSTPNADHS